MPLSHESLTVYQRSIQFTAWSSRLIREKKITGVLLDQMKRAFISVPLNIAEGSGKNGGRDQARFYDIARGSALECGACLDVLVAMEGTDNADITAGKKMLEQIVSMLTGLSRSVDPTRMREDDDVTYGSDPN